MDEELSIEEAQKIIGTGSILCKVRSFTSCNRRRLLIDANSKILQCQKLSKYLCTTSNNKVIEFKDIEDVRRGWKTDVFNNFEVDFKKKFSEKKDDYKIQVENRSFSILYLESNSRKSLDLICPKREICDAWIRVLNHWIALEKNMDREDKWKTWLKNHFATADVNKSGGLNFNECKKLLKQLNIDMNEAHARVLFNKANINKNKVDDEDILDMDEFIKLHDLLRRRPEIEEIFNFCTNNNPVMTPNKLLNFLQDEQKLINSTIEEAKEIIEKHEPENKKQNELMSIDGFVNFLTSLDIFNPNHGNVYQDMTRPLNEYFMASSHNTYLTGGQIVGNSSVEGYIKALKDGCRCVELDLWDGDDGEPSITHGHTPTSTILLKDVLQDAVKPHAFESNSRYPLILSLENHLSVDQQIIAAKYFQDILEDFLYKEPLTNDVTKWPSPEELKHKIIIKGKTSQSTSSNEDNSSKTKSNKPEIAPELSNLINLCQAVKFDDLKTRIAKGTFYHCCSLKESKAFPLAKCSLDDFIMASHKQMFRIYPKNLRVHSSNYDPIPMWNAGCQMVALNYQTKDEAMDLNWAKFRGNGNCGLILKPQYLITGRGYFDDELEFTKELNIKVISGQYIPKPNQSATGEIVDPYVQIKITGYQEDNQIVKTNHVNNNGFNPTWNSSFNFTLKYPELAFVQFVIRDHETAARDEILGQYTIAFEDIQPGYRHIHLMNSNHEILNAATIFVHVEIK